MLIETNWLRLAGEALHLVSMGNFYLKLLIRVRILAGGLCGPAWTIPLHLGACGLCGGFMAQMIWKVVLHSRLSSP